MRRTIHFLILILTATFLRAEVDDPLTVVELPRPNSGTFTPEQAEKRKLEILSNRATKMLASWKNPFNGFSIHIHKDDSISIYGLTVSDDKRIRPEQSVQAIKKKAKSIPLFGNPAGILITSEIPLKRSKVIHKILEEIFVPIGPTVLRPD